MEHCFGIYKKYWAKKAHGGPTSQPQGWGHALPPWARSPALPPAWQAPGAHFLLYEGLLLVKKSRGSFRGEVPLSRGGTWGRTNLGLRWSCSPRDTSFREGETPSSSPMILLSGGVQSPSTSSPAPSPLKTLVHLLYSNHKLVLVGC